ncbi:MAG: hypothetical protein EP350_03670 [Alphaproteobacteria bacterium]|nr:MAG: hypothetical protein EP350_03670 [Alphaproteobacteria bacterium]
MIETASLAEMSFERLAEARGDITQDVLEIYYRKLPAGRDSFIHHGLGNVPELEGRMVAATAFLLMKWADDPWSAKIEQGTTIVHHNDTLMIPPSMYIGLIDAVLEVLLPTIPSDRESELALWRRVRDEIAAYIESLRDEFWRKDESGPLPAFPAH